MVSFDTPLLNFTFSADIKRGQSQKAAAAEPFLQGAKFIAKKHAQSHHRRDTHQIIRLYAGDAPKQVFIPHAWVDEYHRGANPKKSKSKRDKIYRRPDHEHNPVAAMYPFCSEIGPIPVSVEIKLHE